MAKQRVAIVSRAETIYEQAFLRGARRYQSEHPAWNALFMRDRQGLFIGGTALLECDGVILQHYSEQTVRRTLRMGQPVIYSAYGTFTGCPSVMNDQRGFSRVAVDYLAGLGLKRLGYFWDGTANTSDIRADAFREACDAKGIRGDVFIEGRRQRGRKAWSLQTQLSDLGDWLAERSPGVGFFTHDDVHAERAVQACRLAGLRIPEDVAIVTASEDAEYCELADPPLTQIRTDASRHGYICCQLMDKMLRGQPVENRPHLIEPYPPIERASTDLQRTRDPLVASMLRWIDEHVGEELTTERVLQQARVSRNTLDARFRAALGRSVSKEVRRVKLQRAKDLLRDTDLPLVEIVVRCGLADTPQLCRWLKSDTGQTPQSYRRWSREPALQPR